MFNFLSDFIARLNFGYKKGLNKITVHNSKFLISILEILYNESLINGFTIKSLISYKNSVDVFLKYYNQSKLFSKIVRVSNSSRRVYVSYSDCVLLCKKNINVLYILSTSKGIIVQKNNFIYPIGGELILKIFLY